MFLVPLCPLSFKMCMIERGYIIKSQKSIETNACN